MQMTGTERYSLTIDGEIRTKQQLFARYTDTIYLGESGIGNWDWFTDLLWMRLEHSDIVVDVVHDDLSRLPERDRRIYLDVIADI